MLSVQKVLKDLLTCFFAKTAVDVITRMKYALGIYMLNPEKLVSMGMGFSNLDRILHCLETFRAATVLTEICNYCVASKSLTPMLAAAGAAVRDRPFLRQNSAEITDSS